MIIPIYDQILSTGKPDAASLGLSRIGATYGAEIRLNAGDPSTTDAAKIAQWAGTLTTSHAVMDIEHLSLSSRYAPGASLSARLESVRANTRKFMEWVRAFKQARPDIKIGCYGFPIAEYFPEQDGGERGRATDRDNDYVWRMREAVASGGLFELFDFSSPHWYLIDAAQPSDYYATLLERVRIAMEFDVAYIRGNDDLRGKPIIAWVSPQIIWGHLQVSANGGLPAVRNRILELGLADEHPSKAAMGTYLDHAISRADGLIVWGDFYDVMKAVLQPGENPDSPSLSARARAAWANDEPWWQAIAERLQPGGKIATSPTFGGSVPVPA